MYTQEILKHSAEDRNENAAATVVSVFAYCRKLIGRGWQTGRTSLLWKWRLYALGKGSVLGAGLYVNNPRTIAIGCYVTILSQFVLADLRPAQKHRPKIVIGDGCTILYRFQCNAAQSVRIGQNVLIAPNVLITDSDHVVEPGGLPVTKNSKLVTQPVNIGDNCWLGQNAVILKGVNIGSDCIVGANSVVTSDVPSCSIVAGSPARLIKRLNESNAERTESFENYPI